MKDINFRVIWTIASMHFKQMAVDGFVIFTVLVQPLFIALLAIYLLRDAGNFQAIYVVVGSGMAGLWSGTIFMGSRGVVAERWAGTLEEIVGSPTDLSTVVLSKSLATSVISIISMVFSYPLAALLFGFPLTISNPLLFVLSLPLVLAGVISLGFVFAPIMALNPGTWIWSNAIEFPVYAVSGFLFPVLMLPTWSRPVSYLLSPYWAARVLHDVSIGTVPFTEVLICWAVLVSLTLINWFVAMRLFKVVQYRTRVEATLGQQ